MIGLDKIFVISLPNRNDRQRIMVEELNSRDIGFQFWWATSHETGAIGLLESVKSLLKYCIENGHYNVLVLEDDCRFLVKNVKGFLNAVVPQLPEDYHCFYLGLNLISQPTKYSENLLQIQGAYGTHAIMYSKTGMEVVLNELQNHGNIPYDILLMQRVQGFGKCYCTYPMLADQYPSFSDIDKVERDWGKHMNITYAMHTKKLHMEERIPCKDGHEWDHVKPSVDPNRFEPQFPELWGKPCDCGKVKILQESGCGCSGGNKWEIVVVQNT